MSSDMPPGVNVNDIPGNRPEDEAEERFWDALLTNLQYEGFDTAELDALIDRRIVRRAIQVAQLYGYGQGHSDGYAEAEIDAFEAQEAAESDYE